MTGYVSRIPLKIHQTGNSLAVLWLRLSAFTARAWVQSLVGELRSHKPRGQKKKKKEKRRRKNKQTNS